QQSGRPGCEHYDCQDGLSSHGVFSVFWWTTFEHAAWSRHQRDVHDREDGHLYTPGSVPDPVRVSDRGTVDTVHGHDLHSQERIHDDAQLGLVPADRVHDLHGCERYYRDCY
ncbi:hypothetical protein BGZ54_005584, partial [Gamsiella multidivaricata]